MFHSKVRPIIIPQYEHGRLAGTLAQHWGNENFDRPVLDFSSFVNGVALHDWHYGFYDNLPISGADEADWLAITRRGMNLRFDDPVADIVAKLHLRRLLSFQHTPQRLAMMAEVDQIVAARLPETGYQRAVFDWADKITGFCDFVAFHFSFEAPYERTMMVCARIENDAETALTYRIKEGGSVEIDPWPLAVPFITGNLLGFADDGYPELLRPTVVPFYVSAPQVNV
ncbi:MAG: DUF3891 family protein [Candidatus Promineifilaceae bacterium]|nr:DUF3891 family protein [Candidatus Promineifilaceae bacterium]